ncbi:MAG: chemotaxis protein CheA [Thermodesulfobacteriota bacterium]|nr:chemotaxis protein CheA [Thermodesulfobacteriota bacterium]
MNVQDETTKIFQAEAEDLLKSAEACLLRLEDEPVVGPDVEELFRDFHTLKSSFAVVGFDAASKYIHMIENLLERVRSNEVPVTNTLVSLLLENVDFIHEMLNRGLSGEPVASSADLEAGKAGLDRFLAMGPVLKEEKSDSEDAATGEDASPEKSVFFYSIGIRFKGDLFLSGQDPILLLMNLTELGECLDVTADLSELPSYDEMDIFEMYISWKVTLKTSVPVHVIEDVFMFVKDENDISINEVADPVEKSVNLVNPETPIGEVLVETGGITGEELKDALSRQKMVGEILVEQGKIGKDVLERVVSRQKATREAYRKTTIRIDVEKIDYLVNLAEEIGIAIPRMQSLFSRGVDTCHSEIEQELENLIKINQDFQERVASVRMFPLEGTFRRFQRVARDTAHKQKKKIKVRLSGVGTEMDKEVIEAVTDPLKHMVRNCVDHGIEKPEERKAAGKPEEGIIEFGAYRKAGKILIEIKDDGRGLDVDEIYQKALDKGIAKPGEVVDDNKILDFLCRPGFSTTTEVTSLSGRGVGMDVVKTEVERLGGSLSIETEKGSGTAFTLAIPLTFALTQVLHVRVNGISYLLPLLEVIGTMGFEAGRLKSFGADENVYRFRGEYVPLIDLSHVFGISGGKSELEESSLIFFDTGYKRYAIIVDEILDPYQVVVKSLESNYRSVKGITGATIMGDGTVALVIDLLSLEEIFYKDTKGSSKNKLDNIALRFRSDWADCEVTKPQD